MFKFDKKNAFTLAEMLVTIGLIGAISALTIPTLAYNYRSKVLEEQFRSTYSDVRQIGAMINYEKGDVGEYANKITFTAWQKDFVGRLNGGNNLLGSESPSALQTKYTQTLKDGGGSPGLWAFNLSGGALRKVNNICDNGSIWLDSKGRLWTFNSEMRIICVDVNGTANPNRINIDTFAFIPMSAKMVATYVYDDPNNPTNYSGSMVLCDLDRLTLKGLSNTYPQTDDDGNYKKNNPVSAYDTCPFNEPVENIAAVNSTYAGKSARNKTVTTSNNYWKDYINYK
ncbi:type II secretion system protein [bacterium]|nr:type II secretion system protein [bacterium]